LHSRQRQKGILHKPKTVVVGMSTKLKQKHNGKNTGVQRRFSAGEHPQKKRQKKRGSLSAPPHLYDPAGYFAGLPIFNQ